VEMIRNLSNEELSELTLASDERFLQQELTALPAQAREAADRSDEFWAAQRAAVWSKIAGRERAKLRRPVLVGAAAAAIIAIGILFVPQKTKPAVTVVPPPAISDQELLIQVERVVQSGAPASLQPAGLLMQEVAQYAPTVQTKESHEN
jgi:hypothetical protein